MPRGRRGFYAALLMLMTLMACQAEPSSAPQPTTTSAPTASVVASPTRPPVPSTAAPPTAPPSPTQTPAPSATATAPATPSAVASLVGIYRAEPDRLINIFRNREGLSYIDYNTGRTGPLARLAEDTYGGGPTFGSVSPVDVTATFTRDASGQVQSMTWAPSGSTALTAIKTTPPRQEEARFQNGDVSLAGTLLLPPTAGPHPALVLIHGSERARRTDAYYRANGELLAYHGLAVLLYDKRGVGDSTGVYYEMAVDSNINNLAEDALAGVRLLQTRADIQPRRIGIMGASQAGWVGPRAAAKSDAVAFMVLIVGPSVSPGQENLAESLDEQRRRGMLTLTDDELTERVLKAGPSIYDPLPALQKLNIPVLWLFGGLDRSIPTQASIIILEQLKREQGKNFTIRLYPQANHSMLEAKTGYPDEIPSLSRFVPGYHLGIMEWLREVVQEK